MEKNPYAEALGDREPVQVMTETPAKLAKLLAGLKKEQIEQAPAPGKWTPREVMCHLADCELVWAWRLRLIYEKDNPLLQPFDQDPWAKIYAAYTFEQARLTFDTLRMWNLAFLAKLTDADKQRKATHPERGEVTLWIIVEGIAGHDLHHLATFQKQLPAS
jgi:uncharacterized damage-inducible protein DinB